jgi:hypothetical protein
VIANQAKHSAWFGPLGQIQVALDVRHSTMRYALFALAKFAGILFAMPRTVAS